VILIGGTSGHAAGSKRDRKQIEEATRLQIFPDKLNFGPGKSMGKMVNLREKQSRCSNVPKASGIQWQNSKTPIDTTGLTAMR
jgi:hypothetical protein